MASTPNESKFQNEISLTMQLLVKIPTTQKKNDSIAEKKWPRNKSNVEDNPYQTLASAYSKEMDQLVEEDSIACADAKMTELDDEKKSTMLEP